MFVGEHEFFVRRLNEGGGPPIVLVHGWGDHTAVIWQRVAPILAERRDVIMLDLRNHGRSDLRRGSYEIDDVADDVAGVLRTLDVGALDVVGYSMGGMVSQALTLRHRDLVRTLTLGGTAACPAPGGPATPRRGRVRGGPGARPNQPGRAVGRPLLVPPT